MSNLRYTLTVTPAQAAIIRDACELLARIHLGQIDHVVDEISLRGGEVIDVHEAKNLAGKLRMELFPKGISYPHNSRLDRASNAWDLYQVTRNVIAHNERPPTEENKGDVSYREPMLTGTEPLAEMEQSE